MWNELVLLLHPTFGVLAILASVWVFVETLNAREANQGRIRLASMFVAAFLWLACVVAGYWYVVFYGGDKAIIKAGPWPFAHSFFMESKEHLFFTLLLLGSFLPIATFNNLAASKPARTLVQWVAALVVLLSLAMEGAGAVVSMGVKVALLAQQG